MDVCSWVPYSTFPGLDFLLGQVEIRYIPQWAVRALGTQRFVRGLDECLVAGEHRAGHRRAGHPGRGRRPPCPLHADIPLCSDIPFLPRGWILRPVLVSCLISLELYTIFWELLEVITALFQKHKCPASYSEVPNFT